MAGRRWWFWTLAIRWAVLVLLGCGAAEPEPVGRAIAFVQSQQVKTSDPQSAMQSVPLSFTNPQGAGNLNVAIVGWNDGTSNVTSVTDTRGNTYQLAAGPTKANNAIQQSIYYAANIGAGSNTITVVFNQAAAFVDLRIAEYSGIATTSPLDGTAVVTSQASGSIATPNLTTTVAGDLLVAGDLTQGGTTNPGSGWTSRAITSPDSDMIEDKTAGAPGAYNGSLTVTFGWTVLQVAAFRPTPVSDAGADASVDSSGGTGAGGSAGAGGNGGAGGNASDAADALDALDAANDTSEAAPDVDETGAVDDGGAEVAAEPQPEPTPEAGPDVVDAGVEAEAGGGTCGPNLFPLYNSVDNRTLVANDGTPFPILGRTAWFLNSVNAADQATFLDDSQAKGYDAVEFMAVTRDNTSHVPGAPIPNNAPFDGSGNAPFLKLLDQTSWNGTLGPSPDFTTPNEAYWANVDNLIANLESRGMLALVFPAYIGVQGQGWDQETQDNQAQQGSNGVSKMQQYAAWIATRYARRRNIVWMVGGDQGTFSTAQNNVQTALLAGLKSVGQPYRYFSAEWGTDMAGTDQATFGPQMTLNSDYSFKGDVTTVGRRAYAYAQTRPAFLLEEPYDQEGPDGLNFNGDATQPVRRFQWKGWLSTIGGYMSGNGYVWMFNPGWQQHLNTQGAQDMGRLNAFIRSKNWPALRPEKLGGLGTIVAAKAAFPEVVAAGTLDGSLMVLYVDPGYQGTFAINMSVMSHPFQAKWFDPTSGTYTVIPGTFQPSGQHTFSFPPATNSAGDTDWALVFE